MKTIIISGMTKDKIIGKGINLPWHIPSDLENFKKLTDGNTVIMGLATFQSLNNKPLPNRNNIILSFDKMEVEGADVCFSIDEGWEKSKTYGKDIFIMGGASIYKQFLDKADYMYLSHIKKDYEGDVYFPDWNDEDWEIESRKDMGEFEFVVYKRKV